MPIHQILDVVAHNGEILDVVDFLPGPIWHIIFRHLLLPPTDSTELHNQGNPLGELQQREGNISCVDDTRPLSASKQHEENASALSLDSLKLVGRHQLSISSLPLASADLAILNRPATNEGANEEADPPSVPLSGSDSRLALTKLLSSIAPTVETLLVRHDWPLEDVDAEWSRLHCLGIGFQPETLASLRRHFPSLAWYHIVGQLFLWEGKAEQQSKEPLVLALPSTEGRAGRALRMDCSDDNAGVNGVDVVVELVVMGWVRGADSAVWLRRVLMVVTELLLLLLGECMWCHMMRPSVDVVDLLPGPIWHIIFRLLLLPPADPTHKQKLDASCEELSLRGVVSSLCDFIALQQQQPDSPFSFKIEEDDEYRPTMNPLSDRELYEQNAKRFGSSWHLLSRAMASKKLLRHIISFSVSALLASHSTITISGAMFLMA
ncbi:unnamed protein product [Closterium sp. NIES-64]|nr:unnamed protein product [Closterium sp. NIES-64]